MADRIETIIMDLVVNEQDTIKAITTLETFGDKVTATIALLKQLEVQSGATSQQVANAFRDVQRVAIDADAPFVGTDVSETAIKAIEVENTAKAGLINTNQSLTASQLAVNEAHKIATTVSQLSANGITAQTATINDYKKAIVDVSQELGISYPKAVSLLEKTSLGAEGGTAKLKKALSDLGAEAQGSAKKLKENLIEDGLRSVKTELSAISQMKPPAEQINAVARLSLKMQELTSIPAQDWVRRFSQELGMSNKLMQATSNQVDIMENGLLGTAKASLNLSSVLQTAFGVGMAMLIFGVVQQITNLVTGFKAAIDASNTLRQNLLKLGTAEELMSRAGGEIIPKDFEKLINKLNEKFILTPRIDIVSGLQRLALEAAQLGYGQKELEELMTAAMLIAIKNPGKSLESIIESMTTPLFGGSVKGAQALGFSELNEDNIKLEAKRLGLWQETEGAISAAVRQQVIYSLMVDKTLAQEESLLAAQENSVFAQEAFNKSWSDFSENFGSIFAPMWNAFISGIVTGLDSATEKLKEFADTYMGFMPYLLATIEFLSSAAIAEEFINNFDPRNPAAKLSEIMGRLLSKYKQEFADFGLGGEDTPTGEGGPLEGAGDVTGAETDKMTKDIQSLIEWLDNLGDKASKMAEDFAQAFSRMQADFNEKVLRFMEDWDIARERLIEDSNRNTEKKNKEHFDREYWEYLKFQERLRQLREKYLFNLEDALRERDARQVLRLGSQYAMDVNDATKQYELAKAEREARRREEEAEEARELADKLARLDEDRQLQLDRMKEDQALKEARAQEDHKIAMDRLDDEIEDKLRKLADTWAEQFGLDRDGAEDIYDMLNRFYGQGGLINDLFFYTYENLIGTSEDTYDALSEYVEKYLALAKKMEEARNNILKQNYKNIMPHPGLYDAKFDMPKMPSNVPVVAKTVEVVKNTMVVDMNLSPELQYSIRQQVLQDVNDVLIRFNKTRSM